MIYRFVTWRWVEDLLVEGNLTLVRPERWDDPFELINRPIQVRVSDKTGARATKVPENNNFQVFSQSWTTKCMSDTMLRAYSRLTPQDPENDGAEEVFTPALHATEAIQISTTIRKLIEAIDIGLQNNGAFEHLYMTEVDYMSEDDLAERFVSIYANGPDTGENPACVASLLSIKRDAYEAEKEVRPIVLLNDTAKMFPILKIKTQPKKLINSIFIDPRIGSHRVSGFHVDAYNQRCALLEEWGFASKIEKSRLYSASPIFDAPLDIDAEDCNLSEPSKERWRKFLAQHRSN